MTTRVTVDPCAHRIEVILTEGGNTTNEILEQGTPARDFWVYDNKSVLIREIEKES